MPQRKQIFIPQNYYHIYNRGHNKQAIFLSYKDYQRYLKRLEEYLKKHQVVLLCYCLMPNHIHMILRQETEESIERFIHRLHTSYTMYFNKKYERVGAVFQGRFKAKIIETDEYLLQTSRYIHQNPLEILRAQGPALKLEEYLWSSYKEYINKSSNNLCNAEIVLNYFHNSTLERGKFKYKEFVEEGLNDMDQSRLESLSAGKIPNLSTSELKARPLVR